MRQDLDTLKRELNESMKRSGFAVFWGTARADSAYEHAVYWDTAQHEDPEEYLRVAGALGVKAIVFHCRTFEESLLDEAFDKMEAASMPREESREYDRGLRRIKEFEGFTAALELSFEHGGRLYIYEVLAPWFREYLDIMDQIDDALENSMGPGGGEPGPLGGYFSQN